MSDLLTYESQLVQVPATLISLLGVQPPEFIPPPISEILQFGRVERIVVVLIDNFGLFETTMYKPSFLIEYSQALVMLATQNPFTLGILQQIMYGGFQREPNGFHLLRYLNQNNKSSAIVGRKKDIERYDGQTKSIPKETDMATWIEGAKIINHHNFSWVHFLDFENLHRRQARLGQSPETLIEKLIKRTDKWILSLYKQLRGNSLMVILGDHGRYKMDFEYSGKIAQWRAASVPIAIFIKKD
ncbi:MAG: hypothetical protein ACTSU5_13220 [Promethearchaeota archaeon]